MPAEVFIVEDHNDALRWIYRCIGAKKLPATGSVLLHLDSHPDLQLPTGLLEEEASDPRLLHERLSIGDWILPAVFREHFGDVVWLRPNWAHQLVPEDSVLDCRVGVDLKDRVLRIDSTLPYFVSEMMSAPAARLYHTRSFHVHVLTLHERCDVTALIECLRSVVGTRSWVLDVDLDFFSTRNPFADILSDVKLPVSQTSTPWSCDPAPVSGAEVCHSSVYAALVRIMTAVDERVACLCQNNVSSAVQFRRRVMTLVRRAFRLSRANIERECESDIEQTDHSRADPERECECYREEEVYGEGCAGYEVENRLPDVCQCMCEGERRVCSELRQLLVDIDDRFDEDRVDWLRLYDAACTADERGLPHHVSTSTEIDALMNVVRSLLIGLDHPGVITIARSSLDNYCPPEQVDDIQRHLLEVLRTVFGDVNVHLKY